MGENKFWAEGKWPEVKYIHILLVRGGGGEGMGRCVCWGGGGGGGGYLTIYLFYYFKSEIKHLHTIHVFARTFRNKLAFIIQ